MPDSADSVQQARTRARQRLVGAVVLVAAGVIGFPLLFETQPRPLPVDTPIEIARREAASPALPAPRTAPAPRATAPVVPPNVIAEAPAEVMRDVAVASAPVGEPAASTPIEPKPDATIKPAAEPKPAEPKPVTPKPETKPADSARAQALLEGKESAAKPGAAEGRYVVQVGAFAETTAAREARQKVEKLGLKTYTQVVETSAGKRIRVRVGPFASRGEADKAAEKIKSAGLPSAVYTL